MTFRLTFSEMPVRFSVGLAEDDPFIVCFEEGVASRCRAYEGVYDITPKLIAQTLPTKDRHLYENMMVREIPYTEVSNQHGYTAIIGGNPNGRRTNS